MIRPPQPLVQAAAVAAVLTAAGCFCASAAYFSAWRWTQQVVVTAPGLVRVELPPATLDRCRPDLADLRLLDDAGAAVPYLLDAPAIVPPRSEPVAGFQATLDGRATVLTGSVTADVPIEAVELESPAPGFLKPARVDGRRRDGEWVELTRGELVFRQPEGGARLRIPLAPAPWDTLRVTLDDARSAPVPVTGMRVVTAAVRPPAVAHATPVVRREEAGTRTRLTLDLGARNLHLAELRIEVTDPLFSRGFLLEEPATGPDGQMRPTRLAEGSVFRVVGEAGLAAANLTVPVHARVGAATVVLTLENGSSPPLEIRAVAVTRYPTRLLCFATRAGTWQLLSGNRHAVAPAYDLARLDRALDRSAGPVVQPGPPLARGEFQPPVPLPDVEAAGTPIDLGAWRLRRPLLGAVVGAVRVEIDAATLAAARSDLGDLRLVHHGRQIPYLIGSTAVSRAVEAEVVPLAADPQRPTRSRWQVTLPWDELPALELVADSPDPLFTRELAIRFDSRDPLGSPVTRTLGAAVWTKTGRTGPAATRLSIPLHGTRMPAMFRLETDNGDNPPITLGSVAIRHAAPAIVAKLPAAQPVFLYFGNPQASRPNYDLILAGRELLAADQHPATLGSVEVLRTEPRRREFDAGSPWLWAALAMVVALLLVLVAKLLPPQTDEHS